MQAFQYLRNEWTESFKAPNKRNKRVLHITLCARQPELDSIECMMSARPEAALSTKDKSGNVPLHSACRHQASVEVIRRWYNTPILGHFSIRMMLTG
mgnify:CR=1 FL=1